MKTIQTIQEVQTAIEQLILGLRNDPSWNEATRYLAPRGYCPEVVLKQDGRKKRCTASSAHWLPANGEISISFRPDKAKSESSFPENVSRGTSLMQPDAAAFNRESRTSTATSPLMLEKQQEEALCDALEEVERQGRPFISLTWFRDKYLPLKKFSWAAQPAERRVVLARVIEKQLVLTAKIPNPQTPSFPTTTLRLNRSASARPRYNPRPIQGAPLSETILNDRGAR